MEVYGYTRVSTAQGTEGESLDFQERSLAGYALGMDWTVDRIFNERGVSGSTPLADRPQGAALLSKTPAMAP
jgi:putative DNA-invertase from lambdoid prophage Rac